MFFAIPQTMARDQEDGAACLLADLRSEEATFIPEMERAQGLSGRPHLAGDPCGGDRLAVYIGSILPMLLVGPLPTMYGAWVHVMTGITQHAGLAEDVLDHRLNSRTVYMNPVMRFIYWNMNYHIEHHMFPMVPYHALPALHEEVQALVPAALSEHLCRLPRDHSGIAAPGERARLVHRAQIARRRCTHGGSGAVGRSKG